MQYFTFCPKIFTIWLLYISPHPYFRFYKTFVDLCLNKMSYESNDCLVFVVNVSGFIGNIRLLTPSWTTI